MSDLDLDTRCTACDEPLNVHHVVTIQVTRDRVTQDREFCSLECADVPSDDWENK